MEVCWLSFLFLWYFRNHKIIFGNQGNRQEQGGARKGNGEEKDAQHMRKPCSKALNGKG